MYDERKKIFGMLKQELGSSFYIANTEKFVENYKSLIQAFRKYYNNTNIAYSYKTNYLPTFCNAVFQNGGFAEVVSSMEAELALRLGIPANKIFFNGPFKHASYLEKFLIKGGTVNLDSIEEFELVRDIAQKSSSRCSVGVRCNFDINDGKISRFGFDAGSNSLIYILQKIQSESFLNLNGLHCHFASRTRQSWRNATRSMCDLITALPKDIQQSIKYVSLGGGIYGEMHPDLRNQFSTPIPSFDEYAQESAMEFSKCVKVNGLKELTLIIEPGTALAANALEFVSEIQSIKTIQSEVFVTTNGSSFNLGTAKSNINLPFEIIHYGNEDRMTNLNAARVVGYTCIENDVLHSSFTAVAAVGDLIIFKEAGSYSIVMKPPFILPNVAIVELTKDRKQYRVLKRGEKFNDIFGSYDI